MPIAIAPSDIVESPGVARVGDADAPQPGLFDGQPVADGDVVVRFTWPGDVNLNGNDDQADLSVITAATGTGWSGGDFDYNGLVDSNDEAVLQSGQAAIAAAPPASITAVAGADFPVSGLPTTTPAGGSVASWMINWGGGDYQSFGPAGTVVNPFANAAGSYPVVLTALDADGDPIYIYPMRFKGT
jgi:hypothetical protein